mgnify:CR=1 FL=1
MTLWLLMIKKIINILQGLCVQKSEKKSKTKIAALKNLFSCVPEMKSDANSGNAAKTAMLNSMIDTAEYIYSDDFYHVFKNLPYMYEKDKESLIKKHYMIKMFIKLYLKII